MKDYSALTPRQAVYVLLGEAAGIFVMSLAGPEMPTAVKQDWLKKYKALMQRVALIDDEVLNERTFK